jgi:hypothetical protein
MSMEATRPFGLRLRDLLIEREITTGMGNPNWSAFAEQMPGVHYETLRKAVTGERAPAPALMERCAEALGIEADEFDEYRVFQAQRQFDPREVGLEAAMENLRLFTEARGSSSKKKR